MTPKKIKAQLKKIAQEFNLKFNINWFVFDWISKEQEIFTEFLSDCEDPVYNKYGKTLKKRILNLDKFIASKDFGDCIKRFGGQVYTKKGVENDQETLEKIKNSRAKKELKQLIKTAQKHLKHSDNVALLTKTKIKKEKEWLFKHVLLHEWVHLLLYKNKIKFQNKGSKYWKYDEGLNEFLINYSINSLDKLEKLRDQEKYPYEKQYFIYAIKWRAWLKNCKTPQQRKSKILEVYRRLK